MASWTHVVLAKDPGVLSVVLQARDVNNHKRFRLVQRNHKHYALLKIHSSTPKVGIRRISYGWAQSPTRYVAFARSLLA
jgi:hypothetical protein